MKPTLIIISGPNGAGKTTFARNLITERLPNDFEFLNADLIADALSPFKPQSVAIAAGKEFLARFDQLLSQQTSFVAETTLSSLTLQKRLKKARLAAYRIQIIFISLPNSDLAVERVKQRVKLGGHDIPETTIRRRFVRSIKNFDGIYLSLSDTAVLLDGKMKQPGRIARWNSGVLTQVNDTVCFAQYLDRTAELEEEATSYDTEENLAFIEMVDQTCLDVEKFLTELEATSGIPLVEAKPD